MFINPGTIRSWLYTSEFKDLASQQSIVADIERFKAHNKILGLSGFLITNGTAVMQLLEGPEENLEAVKSKILRDKRHINVKMEAWELETSRAYPDWSMRAIEAADYEALFSEIQSAKIATIATDIARLLFDVTFDP